MLMRESNARGCFWKLRRGGGAGGVGGDVGWRIILTCYRKSRFVLPGGKVVVFTGILGVTQDEDGLAVVLGHGSPLPSLLSLRSLLYSRQKLTMSTSTPLSQKSHTKSLATRPNESQASRSSLPSPCSSNYQGSTLPVSLDSCSTFS